VNKATLLRRIDKLEALIREEADSHYCAWCGSHNTEMGMPHERGCPAARLLPDLMSWARWRRAHPRLGRVEVKA
jgi:hypothetical protein